MASQGRSVATTSNFTGAFYESDAVSTVLRRVLLDVFASPAPAASVTGTSAAAAAALRNRGKYLERTMLRFLAFSLFGSESSPSISSPSIAASILTACKSIVDTLQQIGTLIGSMVAPESASQAVVAELDRARKSFTERAIDIINAHKRFANASTDITLALLDDSDRFVELFSLCLCETHRMHDFFLGGLFLTFRFAVRRLRSPCHRIRSIH